MKILAASGYLTLFRDFKLVHMIRSYRSASWHQVLKMRERYICYMGIISEQKFCLYFRESVSERLSIFNMFPINLLSLVPAP